MSTTRCGVRVLAVLLGMGTLRLLSASPVLLLDPLSGDLSGPPGSLVGWGFTITNDSGYIEINSAQFCINPVVLPGCNDPVTGTFTDIISGFNDIVVGPPGGTDPDSVTQSFDAIAETGIGSVQIDPLATPGTSDMGEIVLSYTLFTLDPNDPNTVVEGTGALTADASVTVTVTASPEPGTAGLLAITMAALAVVKRRALLSRVGRLRR